MSKLHLSIICYIKRNKIFYIINMLCLFDLPNFEDTIDHDKQSPFTFAIAKEDKAPLFNLIEACLLKKSLLLFLQMIHIPLHIACDAVPLQPSLVRQHDKKTERMVPTDSVRNPFRARFPSAP